ncbi:hypothetical protein ACWGHA_32300 [Streptomyces xanthophaeus]
MEKISVEAMDGGRHFIYVAHFEVTAEEMSRDWGEGELFDDEWDLGPRRIYCWRLSTGSCVSLNRIENGDVSGFSFYVRADSDDPDLMNYLLHLFLEESHLSVNSISERMF